MEKQKSWQLYLILAVIVITLYNIFPTIFYYAKPLKDPIDAPHAQEIATSIVGRVNTMENDSKAWLSSFCKLLGIKEPSVELKENDPRFFAVTFNNENQAALFRRFLPRAGAMIPFVPAQLELYSGGKENLDPKTVYVVRQIGVKPEQDEINALFHYAPKYSAQAQISELYREIAEDQAVSLGLAFGGPSKIASQMAATVSSGDDSLSDDSIIAISKEIIDANVLFPSTSPLAKRYFASFLQIQTPDPQTLLNRFTAKADTLKSRIDTQRTVLAREQKQMTEKGESLEPEEAERLSLFDNQSMALQSAMAIIRLRMDEFKAALKPLTEEEIKADLLKNGNNSVQIVSLAQKNPFVQSLLIDWEGDRIQVRFYDDVQEILDSESKSEASAYVKERVGQLVINDIARSSSLADEKIAPYETTYAVSLNTLTGTKSILAFDLGQLAKKQTHQIIEQIQSSWTPKHVDLIRKDYPILDWKTYKALTPQEQKLGLVIYAPAMYKEAPQSGFRTGSIYVIARGMDAIMQKYRQTPNANDSEIFQSDIEELSSILQQNGFIGYSGASWGLPADYHKDYIFELDDYYTYLLGATRENFRVHGSKRYAILDFTDVEQRILTMNRIDDRIQEDLVKWEEEYRAAQVDINATSKYLVPAPTKNPYWENFKLSFVKYFRGDDRKILKWGLDLSGGKTVRISLRDRNNHPVTNPDDLKQAVNELYNRINKLGVSERTIRIEGNNILVDFPGSQNLSASELVKASAMYFHIVNEKFTARNPALKDAVNKFLQDVWNEAVVTNRQDMESVNEIAWEHLGGQEIGVENALHPRSEAARILYENGLRLANPKQAGKSSEFNHSLSSIGIIREDSVAELEGQAYPLIIIFHDYALEGSSLTNVLVGYDSTEGNILTFSIKKSFENRSGSPRDDFYAWTSQFSEDKIVGTPKESYSQGHGWRMAVILNGSIITKPTLRAALRDGATISGRFSQREVNQLAADLKAGSLSFTPRILSEQNVSAELGYEERSKGIIAALVALVLVVVLMISYYRFGGVVASCAVLFNILIMWGVLQNLGAALTLPGIAGIVLTIGMAVDANVLVFERIREEFKISGRIASAIQAGYRKAFSAIFDSNITTIIAALILIQFDSGPIKGFAVTLIIGIISSMFTSLFMTRYFFAGWVQNPKHKSLNMAQFFERTNFDFLAMTKRAVTISIIFMAVGTFFFIEQRHTMFGMDFTGGYSLTVDVKEQSGLPSYRLLVSDALLAQRASINDFQVRELSRPNQLRIQLGMGMEEQGHPFYQLPQTYPEGKYAYAYQSNPRIIWIANALEKAGLTIEPSELGNLDKNWTVMSGQFSEAMRFNAIVGLAIALLCILVYITFRFEFKYALGAVIGLAHDVVITVGILALFHRLGFPVQIDLQVIGALMTIIGYSLNDTIIVFDRIREDLTLLRKLPFSAVVNHALNVTLSRTVMTSGTTLIVLLALVILGGKSIFSFSLVMTIGVLVGTLSSLFIASPVMIYFHNREERVEKEMRIKKA